VAIPNEIPDSPPYADSTSGGPSQEAPDSSMHVPAHKGGKDGNSSTTDTMLVSPDILPGDASLTAPAGADAEVPVEVLKTPSKGGSSTSPSTATVNTGSTAHPHKVRGRTLITYVYAESATARENIKFFVKHGLHAAADFIFIINGETDILHIIPKADNIKVVERENDCYDLGSHAEILTMNNLWKGYKKFVLMNASIRGPFMPIWAEGCWTDMYLARVTEKVKVSNGNFEFDVYELICL
jgi:hypothetical protein